MPYYDQNAQQANGGMRDRITQALMNVQNPPPQTQMPQMPQVPSMPAPMATPGAGAAPPMAAPQAATMAPGVTPQPPMMGGGMPTMPGGMPSGTPNGMMPQQQQPLNTQAPQPTGY